jgi:AcrR family transcriptional regulator
MASAVANPAASTRTRLSAPERRRDVVAAVVELARESSPEGITTQAIAERVGVTHGALFRHFPDKQAMWAAVFDWIEEEMGNFVGGAFAAGGKPLEILERVFLDHVRFVAGHPGVPRIVFHELQGPAGSALRERAGRMVRAYRVRIGSLLADAKRGRQLPASLDEEMAALLFVGAVQGLAVQSSLLRGEAGMNAAARRLFPLLLDGFRGRPR